MRMKSLLVAAAAAIGCSAFATNFTWTGGGDGTSWNAPANWGQSSNYPQTTGDVAIFNGNANVSLNTGSATTIGYVKVTAGTVTIDATEEGSSLNCTQAAAGNGGGNRRDLLFRSADLLRDTDDPRRPQRGRGRRTG